MRLPAILIRETLLTAPGLGTFYVHTARWRPGRIRALGFAPEGRDRIHAVPVAAWDAVTALIESGTPVTYEQVMALIRRHEDGAGPAR